MSAPASAPPLPPTRCAATSTLGLLVTLNSDDPAFFGSDLANEFLLAHTEQGFTRDELRQLAANSIRASFLPESIPLDSAQNALYRGADAGHRPGHLRLRSCFRRPRLPRL
jgi:hypothetical protein